MLRQLNTRKQDIEIVEHILDSVLQIKNIVVKTELMLTAMKGLNDLEDEALHQPEA